MRTLVIGDIHGGLKALRQVLDRAQVKPSDRLIFLGDYVDGWSDSVATVSFLLQLKTTHHCILLRGNHDQLAQEYLQTQQHNALWLAQGGWLTAEGYEAATAATRAAHLEFYQQLESFHVDAQQRLFCHAGFTDPKGPTAEYYTYVIWWDRTLWELALALNPDLSPNDPRYPTRLKQFEEIYIGHTPLYYIGETQPTRAGNVWNMDTSAAYKGSLSILDVDSKQVWQSDPVHTLYPDEKGRN